MFRFLMPILAGIGIGALVFGGAGSTGFWLLAFIPLFIFIKIAFFGLIFGAFARRGSHEWRRAGYGPPWTREGSPRNRRDRSRKGDRSGADERPGATDRFEEWHRMAHAKDEVESWAPKPE